MEENFGQDGTTDARPPPKKRSLFTKAALAKTSEAEDAVAFFSRANELQAQRLAEEERRRQKNIVRLERKRSSASVERNETTPEIKRRRTSTDADGGERYSSEGSVGREELEEATWTRRESTLSTPGSGASRRPSSQSKAQTSPTTLSGRYSKSLQVERPGASQIEKVKKNVITIGDSDSEDDAVPAPIVLGDDDDYVAPRRVRSRRREDDPQLSDEEFPELVQKARERQRQRELQLMNAAKSFVGQNHSNGGPDPAIDDEFQLEPMRTDVDPAIDILITSIMEGTKPVMVRRRLSQKLQQVRHAWCDRQTQSQLVGEDLKNAVFLTWKHKRLFDSTSCQALGLKIDRHGKPSSDDEGVDRGRVHLEAWTEKTFIDFQKGEEARLRKEQGDGFEEDATEQVEEVVKIRLIIKAKDMEIFKLVVKPTTRIAKLVIAFRQSRMVPEEKDIALYFDGDRLDPESTIESTELGELDTVEAHIR